MKGGVAPIGGAAGIKEKDAVDDMTSWLVTVAVNDAIDLLTAKGPQDSLFEIVLGAPAMDEADPLPRYRNYPPLGQFGWVEIATHRQQRLRQQRQELRIDDIAGVKNQLRAGKVVLTVDEQGREPRIAESQMSIGKDADAHELTHWRKRSAHQFGEFFKFLTPGHAQQLKKGGLGRSDDCPGLLRHP